MLAGVWTIYRKELVDTLRDRKTLIFMLLIPTLAIPAMFAALEKIVSSSTQKQALERVRIAADEPSRARYRQLVHAWFLQSPLADGLRIATSPVMRSLIDPAQLGALGEIPPEIFTDPAVFAAWTRAAAAKAREGVDSGEGPPADVHLPPEMVHEVVAFYEVAFKGLGLIEFVDPGSLTMSAAPVETLPRALAGDAPARAAASAIKAKTIHGYLIAPEQAAEAARAGPTVELTLLHDSTLRLSEEARRRVQTVLERVNERLVQARLRARDLDRDFLTPLRMRDGMDLATESQIALSYIGGILPYFVIAFAFLGGMYPAIDLGAGEKERNTLETLILSPSTRAEIAIGKFLVITTTALTAAVAGLASIAISVRYVAPPALLRNFDLNIEPATAVMIGLLAIPPAVAFAGLFLAISIYARSFKEAQNYMAPLQFVLILPALAPMLPGLELNWKMALIPLVNVSMLSKDFLKGDTHWGYYALTLFSCGVLAAGCVAYAVRQFHREDVLFRS